MLLWYILFYCPDTWVREHGIENGNCDPQDGTEQDATMTKKPLAIIESLSNQLIIYHPIKPYDAKSLWNRWAILDYVLHCS